MTTNTDVPDGDGSPNCDSVTPDTGDTHADSGVPQGADRDDWGSGGWLPTNGDVGRDSASHGAEGQYLHNADVVW